MGFINNNIQKNRGGNKKDKKNREFRQKTEIYKKV